MAEQFYYEKSGKKVPFITGDIWHAASLQNAFGYTVKAAPCEDPILFGLHLDTVNRHGALAISSIPQGVSRALSKYIKADLQWQKMEIKYSARFGKVKKYDFYLAVIPSDSLIKTENKK